MFIPPCPSVRFGTYNIFAFPGTPASIYSPLETRLKAIMAQSKGAVRYMGGDEVRNLERAYNRDWQNWDNTDTTRMFFIKTPDTADFNGWDTALRQAREDNSQIKLTQITSDTFDGGRYRTAKFPDTPPPYEDPPRADSVYDLE